MNHGLLLANEPIKARSKSRYLAALNIKRALPDISDQTHIPDFFKDHKVHAGPFLWLARDGHYEYTHFDPQNRCCIYDKPIPETESVKFEFESFILLF